MRGNMPSPLLPFVNIEDLQDLWRSDLFLWISCSLKQSISSVESVFVYLMPFVHCTLPFMSTPFDRDFQALHSVDLEINWIMDTVTTLAQSSGLYQIF